MHFSYSTLNMIKVAVLAAVVLGSMAAVLDKPYYDLDNAEDLFREFVKKYEKTYNGKEYFERLEIFKKGLYYINSLNADSSRAVFAVNHFTDLKPEELERYRGVRLTNEKGVKAVVDRSLVLPESFDWREHDAVTHVKNLLLCANSHIFSAIGNIEGQYAIKHKECLSLSEQHVTACLHSGTCGVMRLTPHQVMQEFVNRSKADGPMLEDDYPYTGEEGDCHEDAKKVAAHVTSGDVLNIRDEYTLLHKLYELGPLAVGVGIDRKMEQYQSGIFDQIDGCGRVDADNFMVLVGYGEEDGTKYWILKNAWGTKWGEGGYIRLLRGVNACHMGTSYAASATVA